MLAKLYDNQMKIAWVISEKHALQKWQFQSDFHYN